MWLTRLGFSIPKGLGSVHQIIAFKAACSQGSEHAGEAGLPHSTVLCCVLPSPCDWPWQAWIGVRLPSEGVMCCISKCLALCFVCCSLIIWRNPLWGLMGPPGKDGSSWGNFKNLRFRKNSWYGLRDIVKLFKCRKPCGHGTFLFSLGQIPLLCSFQAAAERVRAQSLGQGVWHRGRSSRKSCHNSASLNSCRLAVVDLTNLSVLSCLAQTNKCKTDLLKAIDVVEWSGLKFWSIPGLIQLC